MVDSFDLVRTTAQLDLPLRPALDHRAVPVVDPEALGAQGDSVVRPTGADDAEVRDGPPAQPHSRLTAVPPAGPDVEGAVNPGESSASRQELSLIHISEP